MKYLRSSPTVNVRQVVLILIVISLIGIFYIFTIRDGHNWGGDFSMYIHHAKNIFENKNYADVGYIYNPWYTSIGPKVYPPVFPLLLVPIYKYFGLNYKAMKIYIICFFLVALILIYIYLKGQLPYYNVILLVAIIGFNPYFWIFKENILSDIPFLSFIFIVFIINDKSCENRKNVLVTYLYLVILGIMIYISYATRVPGILLLPSVILYRMFMPDTPKKPIIITVLIFTILWFIQKQILPNMESDYIEQFFNVKPGYILSNIHSYTHTLSGFWNNCVSWKLRIGMFIFASFFSIIGLLSQLKIKINVYMYFTIFYITLIILWPSRQGMRFLIPIIPFYIFYAAKGIEYVNSKISKRITSTVIIMSLITLSVMYLTTYMSLDFGPIYDGVTKKESEEMFKYIRENTEANAVIIFRKPRVLALLTDRKSSVYHDKKPKADAELWAYFKNIKATHIITNEKDDEYFKVFVKTNLNKIDSIFFNKDFTIYRIRAEEL